MKAVRLDVSFFADGSVEDWKLIAERLGMTPVAAEDDPDIAVFAALPAELVPFTYYLVGSFHPTAKDPADSTGVHWHLEWAAMPEEPPPESIALMSQRVGGYPEVVRKFVELCPEAKDLSMRYSVLFVRESAENAGPPTLDQVTLRGKFQGPLSPELPATIEEIAWHGLIQAAER